MRIAVVLASALMATSSAAQSQPATHVFASPGGVDLKAHVFAPPGTQVTAPRPAIVIFHGGGWAEGDAEWAFPRARHFAERGMVAVAAQYRLSDGKGITPPGSRNSSATAGRPATSRPRGECGRACRRP